MNRSRKEPLTKTVVDKERERLYRAIGSFMHSWNDLEEAVGELFGVIARMGMPLGAVTFYSVSTFEGRTKLVSNLFEMRTQMPNNDWAKLIGDAWFKIKGQMDRRRGFRNVIAHGKPSNHTIIFQGKIANDFTWGPQPGDFAAIHEMNKDATDRNAMQRLGYTPNEIEQSGGAADRARDHIRKLRDVLTFIEFGKAEAWPPLLLELAAELNLSVGHIKAPTDGPLPSPLQ